MLTFCGFVVGGVLGGMKYIVNNILFKFAVDEGKMFGGSHDAAAKIAGTVCCTQSVRRKKRGGREERVKGREEREGERRETQREERETKRREKRGERGERERDKEERRD